MGLKWGKFQVLYQRLPPNTSVSAPALLMSWTLWHWNSLQSFSISCFSVDCTSLLCIPITGSYKSGEHEASSPMRRVYWSWRQRRKCSVDPAFVQKLEMSLLGSSFYACLSVAHLSKCVKTILFLSKCIQTIYLFYKWILHKTSSVYRLSFPNILYVIHQLYSTLM